MDLQANGKRNLNESQMMSVTVKPETYSQTIASLVSLRKNYACLTDQYGKCFGRFLNYNKNLKK